MRSDMKDVIIDTGRWYRDSSKLNKVPDEDLPEKEGMRRRWKEHSYFGDRLSPLRRWLKKSVGRPIDKVYSEFCEHNDSRSIRGWHAREHFWHEVETWEDRCRKLDNEYWYTGYGFYVDEKGFLRFQSSKKRPKFNRENKLDPNLCFIGETCFKRINNCWFMIWYEPQQMRTYYSDGSVWYREESVEKRKQLSKKELEEYGLSNKPGFKWWKNNG